MQVDALPQIRLVAVGVMKELFGQIIGQLFRSGHQNLFQFADVPKRIAVQVA